MLWNILHCSLLFTPVTKSACCQARIAELEGGNPEYLAVYLCGRPLEDDDVLAKCGGKFHTLEVDVRVLGGKVHGSLARAGKVKSQTPKVSDNTGF